MNMLVTIIYLTLWVAASAGIIYSIVNAGYSLWLAVLVACVLFNFLNGSLLYWIHSVRFRHEGRKPEPYWKYLLLPSGNPKFKDVNAPRFTQVFAGILATLLGVFFVGCGVALAVDAYLSRMSLPLGAAIILLVLMGIGASLLYVGWRLIVSEKGPPSDAA